MLSPQFEDGWREAQKRLAALSSLSTLIVAEDLGHAMAGEDPDFVAGHILAMVAGLRAEVTIDN